jgi:thiamine transport system permease protein
MKSQTVLAHVVLYFPVVLLVCFLIYPVSAVIMRGVTSGFGTSIIDVLSSPITLKAFVFSAYQAGISTLVAVALGLPGAYLLTRLRFRGKSIVRAAMVIPFVLPPIVVVVGFLQMFGPYGFVDTFAMTILGSRTSILNLASGITGIVLAHAFYNVPLVILMVSASLERLSPDIEESAEILGASTMQKFRRIIVPHILPALLASAILTYLFCFTSFPIVLSLGGGLLSTLEVRIWYAFRVFDYSAASSLALVQILITIALAFSYYRLGGSRDYVSVTTSRIRQLGIEELGSRQAASAIGYVLILLVLVAGPIIAIVRASVYDPVTQVYTWSGFASLLSVGLGGGLVPLVNSVFYAGTSTMLAVVLGLPLAYLHRRSGFAPSTLSSMATFLPLGVSAITLAYGLMLCVVVPLGLSVNPWPAIVLAQTMIGLPFSARSIEIALRNISPALLDQADLLGASRLQKLFFVELPLLAPGILVGAVFAFAMAIGEMSATYFIALPQNFTLTVAIYQDLAVRKFVQAGAAALVLVAVCLVAFLIIDRVTGKQSGGIL